LSWSQRLNGAGILNLANFNASKQAEIMKGLAERFAPIIKEEGIP